MDAPDSQRLDEARFRRARNDSEPPPRNAYQGRRADAVSEAYGEGQG